MMTLLGTVPGENSFWQYVQWDLTRDNINVTLFGIIKWWKFAWTLITCISLPTFVIIWNPIVFLLFFIIIKTSVKSVKLWDKL